MPHQFSAVIYQQGINPCVDIPAEVGRAFGEKGTVPVCGALNGYPIRATLVPAGSGTYRLFINAEMRGRAGVAVGDEISLSLEFYPQPRAVPMPRAFARALEQNPAARDGFERLTPSRQKEILLYMNSLKKPDSLQRAVQRVLDSLLSR